MRKVFFSFYYEMDVWRVSQVRNSWVTKGKANSFLDAVEWEQVRRGGDRVIKAWIETQLAGTSVTVVLIGKKTAERRYVLYELERSYQLGKGILGVQIHQMKDRDGNSSFFSGDNPLGKIELPPSNYWERFFPRTLADIHKTYDWVDDNGYDNLPAWIEIAARAAGR